MFYNVKLPTISSRDLFSEFFSTLDDQVGPINTNTHLYMVARYVGQGLENLNKE